MGDKAVVRIKQDAETSVYVDLHAHWKGPHVAIDLREGLNRGRWEQPNLAIKNILCEMVRGFEDDDARYGISAAVIDDKDAMDSDLLDVDRPLILVDFSAHTVTIEGNPPVSFTGYIELSDKVLLESMGGCSDGDECRVCEQRRKFYQEYPFTEDAGVFHKPPFNKLINPGRRIKESLISPLETGESEEEQDD